MKLRLLSWENNLLYMYTTRALVCLIKHHGIELSRRIWELSTLEERVLEESVISRNQ